MFCLLISRKLSRLGGKRESPAEVRGGGSIADITLVVYDVVEKKSATHFKTALKDLVFIYTFTSKLQGNPYLRNR
jgi:hypothetical protein